MLLRLVTICYVIIRAVLAYGLTRRPPRSAERSPVSVIVAARNEAETLPALLTALLDQTYRDYEVIVVDDRSTDATTDVLEAAQRRDPRLQVVRVTDVREGQTPKMNALAQGVAMSRGSLLLFTDADCRVRETWIEGIVGCFAPEVGAVLGYVRLHPANSTLLEQVQALDYFAMMATLAGATNLGFPIGASGANLAYRRSTYDAAGGFETMPTGAIADDMLLVQRVVDRTRRRVVFCDDPRACVTTDAEPTLEGLLNQRVRWMAGGQEVLGRNPALLLIGSLIGTLNGMLLAFPLLLRRRASRRALVEALVARTLADALHLGVAAWWLDQRALLRFLPLWSVAQVPYTVIVPLYSSIRRWSWKR